MFAVGVNEYGGAEKLVSVEIPEPHPGPGEVRIRVRAAAINPVDIMVRDGSLSEWFAGTNPPYVPGMDVAGTVDEVSEDLASIFSLKTGMHVVGVVDNYGSYGGYSEYICLPAASVTPVPQGKTFSQAASFLMNALTARQALDTLSLPEKSTVLVTGAAGAVGAYAIALGSQDSLRMLAIASGDDTEFLRASGADDVIERGDDLSERILQLCSDGVDAVIDAAGLGKQVVPVIKKGGTLITLRPTGDEFAESGISAVFVNVRERIRDHDAISKISGQVEDGLLSLRVAKVFSVRDASEAHRYFEAGGLRGRVILDFDN